MLGARIGDDGKGLIQAHQGGFFQQVVLLVSGQRRQGDGECGRIQREWLLYLVRFNLEVLSYQIGEPLALSNNSQTLSREDTALDTLATVVLQ